MLRYFTFNTIEFIIHIFIAYTAFIMCWLIFDSKNFEKKKNLKASYNLHAIGFFLIGIYLLFAYAYQSNEIIARCFETLLTIGLILVATGTYLQPIPAIQKKSNRFITFKGSKFGVGLFLILGLMSVSALVFGFSGYEIADYWFFHLQFLQVFLIGTIVLLLSFKYFYGLQKEQKPEIIGFIFFGLAILMDISKKFLFADDLRYLTLTENFGILWIVTNILLFLGFFLLGKFAISFIRFRLKPQLFFSFILTSLIIFFTVTIVFLLLLINDFQKNTLFNLKASAKAVELSIIEMRNDTILAAKALVNNSKIIEGAIAENGKDISSYVEDILTISNVDFITVTNEAGLTIYDTNNPEIYGENLSNDKYLRRSLQGVGVNTIAKDESVFSPVLTGKTYLPIVEEGKVIGSIIVGYVLDDQFVDALKEKTALEVTIFVNNIRSATTFKNGTTRMSGTIESDTKITEKVLKKGETYEGIIDIFNVEHLAIYTPLKDSDDNIIGMLSVAEPSQILIAVANDSVQSTLKILTFLLLLTSIPIYFVVKRLVQRQLI